MVLDKEHGWSVPPTWASHGFEIPFVFGNGFGQFSVADEALSKAMRGYWASFARTGVPSAHGAPAWRPLEGGSPDNALALGVPIAATGDGYRADLCAFWDRYF